VLPDLFEVQSGGTFHIECYVSRDEMCLFGNTVDDYHNHIVAMSLRNLDNEVDTNVCWSPCRVEFSARTTMLQLSLIA
jgi:hypothetical protein